MKIKLLSEKAVIPSRGSKYAAGYDLYTTESYELKSGERKAFKTDVSMAIPHGYYGRIAPRSGLALKKGIDVLGGVIDEDYRGELLVILVNLGQEPIQINIGDKIAQIIFEFYSTFSIEETKGELDQTDRNSNGFGSSDIQSTQSMPPSVIQALEEIYSKNPTEVNNKTRYSDIVKEREKNI